MSKNQRLKLRDGERLIDAEFTIMVTGPKSFELVLESSGGSTSGSRARNSEYSLCLAELLRRVTPIASTLDDCLVVSRVARSLPEDERRVPPAPPYNYPIALSTIEDFGKLRLALTTPQVHIASKATKGGNERKNIALRFTSKFPSPTHDSIQSVLNAEPTAHAKRDRKDIATGVTQTHIDSALKEWREIGSENFHRKYQTSRAAKFVIADPDGFEYDAKAILFAARKFAGLDGKNSDFDGDRSTVQEPLQSLGYVVEDISQDEDASGQTTSQQMTKEEQQSAIQQAKVFAGSTDVTAERKVRREQRLLRKALGLSNGSHACSLCGRTYPDRLLVAAHIKRRSECTPEERVDIPAVAMIACALGCDALFEHGYVTVTDEGLIQATSKSDDEEHLREMVAVLNGRSITNFNVESRPYLSWHRESCQPSESAR
jgi:hypothetical protein